MSEQQDVDETKTRWTKERLISTMSELFPPDSDEVYQFVSILKKAIENGEKVAEYQKSLGGGRSRNFKTGSFEGSSRRDFIESRLLELTEKMDLPFEFLEEDGMVFLRDVERGVRIAFYKTKGQKKTKGKRIDVWPKNGLRRAIAINTGLTKSLQENERTFFGESEECCALENEPFYFLSYGLSKEGEITEIHISVPVAQSARDSIAVLFIEPLFQDSEQFDFNFPVLNEEYPDLPADVRSGLPKELPGKTKYIQVSTKEKKKGDEK